MIDVQAEVRAAMERVEETLTRSVEGSTVIEDVGTTLLESGGKRMRPELLLLSYIAAGGTDLERAVPLATAFELIHTASLIHDDITDDPTLRRRRPAPHRRYGLSRALVAGDYLFAKAFELLTPETYDVAKTVADAAIAMAEGEHLELMKSFDATVTKEQYLEIMEKKTASLFGAAARAGATLAGAEDGLRDQLEHFGESIGIAFQMVDDVLDLEPSAALTGKPSGMDLREGRMTLVLLVALEHLEPEDRKDVIKVFMASSPSQADLDRTLALIRGTGAGGITLQMAQEYAEKANAVLGDELDEQVLDGFHSLAMEVVRRRS
jgi:octaprenyl-diphosphate synthase